MIKKAKYDWVRYGVRFVCKKGKCKVTHRGVLPKPTKNTIVL